MNWDTLHLRFASSVRDGVSTASTDGDELSVSDRDSYLNFAYTKYVRLLKMYNPSSVDKIIPELATHADITASGGSATVPTDFGYLLGMIDLSNTSAEVNHLEVEDFGKMKKVSDTHQSAPSSTTIYYTLETTVIEFLPTTIADSFRIYYIAKAKSVTQGDTSYDIVIGSEHWDTIIAFANAKYYSDKQEFQQAQLKEQDAVTNAPYKVSQPKIEEN